MKDYVYYWYHHMMDDKEQKVVQKTIEDKNFEGFIEQFKRLNSRGLLHGEINEEFDCFIPVIYLPDEIVVYDNDKQTVEYISVLNRENFNKITYNECECG